MIEIEHEMNNKWCPFVQFIYKYGKETIKEECRNRPHYYSGTQCITKNCAMYIQLPDGYGSCGLVFNAHQTAMKIWNGELK